MLMSAAIIGFALVALPVFADETTVTGAVEGTTGSSLPAVAPEKENKMRDIRQIKQEAEQEIKKKKMEVRDGFRAEVKDVREQSSLKREEIKENLKDDMGTRREEFKKQFEVKKEEVKKKFEEEKVRLTEKLKTIKDEKKKEVVKRVSGQFQEINTKKLEHFSNVLKQMEEVLTKIKARAEKATAGGSDISALNAKIVAFETAVTGARAAIVAQSAKVYSIEITTEEHLKNNTGATRQALQKDIKTVFDLVKNAHEALKDIMKELTKVRIVGNTVTNTATTTSNQ